MRRLKSIGPQGVGIPIAGQCASNLSYETFLSFISTSIYWIVCTVVLHAAHFLSSCQVSNTYAKVVLLSTGSCTYCQRRLKTIYGLSLT